MLSLHTNNAALSAQNSISRTQNALSTSMTRLSTGFRINSAMDDAAGLQIATRLKAQSSGMAVAMRNTQNSISMLQTAEGALDEVTNMLVRMKDLATQAADQSSTTDDKKAMQEEFNNLGQELGNVLKNTKFVRKHHVTSRHVGAVGQLVCERCLSRHKLRATTAREKRKTDDQGSRQWASVGSGAAVPRGDGKGGGRKNRIR